MNWEPDRPHRKPRAMRLTVAAIILLSIGGLIALLAEWLPDYDPKVGYTYAFAEPPARRVAVAVSTEGFTLPATSEPWDTGVLRIEVTPTFIGKWLTPAIEAHVDGSRVALQYLEPGAAGARFVNLGSLAALPRNKSHEVRLTGRGVEWQAQSAPVLLFDNRSPSPRKPRVVVIAPHPDDAEIAAFGFYSQHESRVITITAGDSGGKWYDYILPDDAEHAALKGRLRVWDSITIPQLAGVPPAHAFNLGYFDGTIRDLFERRGEDVRARHIDTRDIMTFRRHNVADLSRPGPVRSNWVSLVADLKKLLADARPDIIVTPHPTLDTHPDHVFSTVAVLEAAAAVGLDNARLYFYNTTPGSAATFPFGRNDGLIGLAPWFDAKTSFSGLHSVPLDRPTQVFKLFVLEAHHDFRRGPPALDHSLEQNARRLHVAIRKTVADFVGGDPSSYHRRAARPNELFLVYPASQACALRQSTLEARGITNAPACGR